MSRQSRISRREFINRSIGGIAAASLLDVPLAHGAAPKADLVIHGSPVLTVDADDSVMGAVAIRQNQIIATAKDLAGIQPLIGSGTRVAKVSGGSVTPGMIDVHNHIVAQATTTIGWVDLIRCNSTANAREVIAKWILEHDVRPGNWIRGVGYMWLMDKMLRRSRDEASGPPLMTRWDIDQVVEVDGKRVDLSKYPIYLIQLSGHYASMNGLAMQQAKIIDQAGRLNSRKNEGSLTVPGKTLPEVFSPESHPFSSYFSATEKNGVRQVDGMMFHHYAMEEFLSRALQYTGFPRLDGGELTAALKQRCGEFIRRGITSIYDNNLRVLSMLPFIEQFPKKARQEEKLRITLYPYIGHSDQGAYPAFGSRKKKGVTEFAQPYEGDWMRLIGYKLQIDAGAMTGLTWEPNNCLGDATRGELNLWKYDEYLEIVSALDKMGAQISAHVAGDKALDWTLDAYEQAGIGGQGKRPRLEHVVCVPDTSRNTPGKKRQPLYSRAKDLDAIFCPQHGFILFYAHFYEQGFGSGVGQFKQNKIFDRVAHSIPYRSAVEAGVRIALSSDNPCVPDSSPIVALWSAVHRRTRPLGKGRNAIVPSYDYNHVDASGKLYDERVGIDQAIRGHTRDAAYTGFEEKVKGSLEKGKLADLVVWDGDLRDVGKRIPVMKALERKPILTLIDGEIAYQDKSAIRFERA